VATGVSLRLPLKGFRLGPAARPAGRFAA